MQFDHIGLAVADIDEGQQHLSKLFGIQCWTEVFKDSVIGVYVQFGIGSSGLFCELISPLAGNSPISAAVRTGKGILNRVAYLVTDLEASARELTDNNCMPVDKALPAVARNGHRVKFFFSPLRFIIEPI